MKAKSSYEKDLETWYIGASTFPRRIEKPLQPSGFRMARDKFADRLLLQQDWLDADGD